jgi:MFS family permease
MQERQINARAVAPQWPALAILSSNLALHNLQRFAPVTLYDEFRVLWRTDYTGAGELFAAYLISYALMLFPMGALADRIDNKKLLIFGAALNFGSSALFAFAPNLGLAMVARVLLGISGALLYVPSVRYVVTSFDKKSRGKAMGWVQFGAGVGQVAGLIMIPAAAVRSGLITAFLLPAFFAALLVIGQVATLRGTHAAPAARKPVSSVFASAGFTPFLAFVFLAFLANYAISGWLPTYLRHDFGLAPTHAGMAAALSAIALSVCSPLAGTLSDRLGARKPVLLAGSLVSAVCFAIMAFSHDLRTIVLAAFLKGAASALTIPVAQMFAGEVFAAAGAGVAVGFTSTTGQLASSASGPLFGLALDETSSFSALWTVALACVMGSILFLALVKEPKWSAP